MLRGVGRFDISILLYFEEVRFFLFFSLLIKTLVIQYDASHLTSYLTGLADRI